LLSSAFPALFAQPGGQGVNPDLATLIRPALVVISFHPFFNQDISGARGQRAAAPQ
jgi:hypothetical protein